MNPADVHDPLGPDPKMSRRLMAWFDRHRWVDAVVALLLLATVLLSGRGSGIAALDLPGRRALYQTLAGLSATLFGLTMTTVSIISSSMDKPIGGSPQGLTPALVRGITSRMFALLARLGAMLLLTLTLLIFDTNPAHAPWPAQPLLIAGITLVALGLLRALQLLSNHLLARVPPRPGKA